MPVTEALERAKDWAKNPHIDEASRAEIQALIDQKNWAEIEERFYRDLEFGTGGLRAPLGQGSYRLNKYNICRASWAVAQAVFEDGKKSPKVAISYDCRHNSWEFARETAGVFAAHGVTALVYRRLNPVSLCSFAIRHHQCSAGVMITASHNPPEYNGFKVFWADGAQVTPPVDGRIIEQFRQNTDLGSIRSLDFEEGLDSGLIQWIGEETENAYFAAIKSQSLNLGLCGAKGGQLHVVYTPLHGTGKVPCLRALSDLGLSRVDLVAAQAEPDGNFPTVDSPNPENPGALKMAVDQMQDVGADLVLGTDPDTDRVGLALPFEGEVCYLNGNQIGLLLLHYLCHHLSDQGRMPKRPYLIKTIVTTPLLEKVAAAYGVECENTLTGFKWICKRLETLERQAPERHFIFGAEESFGYLNHAFARDKDGVASVALIAEMALWHKTCGMNLVEALDSLYRRFGFSFEKLLCLDFQGAEGARKMAHLMEVFREFQGPDLLGLPLQKIEDYRSGRVLDVVSGTEGELEFPSSNVLGFYFQNGDRLFLRPSGTEPKIKFYIMIHQAEGSLAEKKARAQARSLEFVDFIKRTGGVI